MVKPLLLLRPTEPDRRFVVDLPERNRGAGAFTTTVLTVVRSAELRRFDVVVVLAPRSRRRELELERFDFEAL